MASNLQYEAAYNIRRMKKDSNEPKHQIVSFGQIEIDSKRAEGKIDMSDLPILATRNLVLFPAVTMPLSLMRESAVKLAQYSYAHNVPIGVVCQKNPEVETPGLDDLYKYGVIADVLKVIELPDGSKTAIISARRKFRILGPGAGQCIPGELCAKGRLTRDTKPRADDDEYANLTQCVINAMKELVQTAGNESSDMALKFDSENNPETAINVICSLAPIDVAQKEELLECSRAMDRAFRLLTLLTHAQETFEIQKSIMDRARQQMEDNQKNAFLQNQMDVIRQELYGNDSDEIDDLEKRAKKIKMPEAVTKTFRKEIDKLRRYNPQSPDYSVQYTYLEQLLALPWNVFSKLNTDFDKAREILESDHYGLQKVKERILEQLAVLIDNPKGKASIICLVGPPGVGKTSLGQSIARALGRKYERVSFGGLHDEAEIRGHRRTYIGAMPGRIIDAVKRAGTSNPVLLLDEIDKIGADYKGDPAAALLEVLDPEQNHKFHDNYIDVDFDLSHVLFIATANTLSSISRPLLDRIEVIEISGYLEEEKIEIAKRHILPRLLEQYGKTAEDLKITDEALAAVIENYTGESGVRQLEKHLAEIIRKMILRDKLGQTFPCPVRPEDLRDLLGVKPFNKDRYEGNDFAGVVTGLAWTEVGGEILLVETSLASGKGDKITLTGNLGNVMKESAAIALQWTKAHAAVLGIDTELFDKYSLHIHFPEGAIPKDGPSAGITMTTAIVSQYTQRQLRPRIAMTGEMTLRGKVLPVGGIKEKILAAKRAGITDIILSGENRKDIEDIEPRYITGLVFHYVDTMMQVLDEALLPNKVPGAINL